LLLKSAPATTGIARFLTAVHTTATLSVLERLARDLLRRIAPRMLIVDEVHHLLAGGYREQRAALNLLKYLANDLKLSIVVVGTADAPLALESDAQMRSRFTPFEIPRWRETEEFRRLLVAFERVLPLRKPSDLSQRSIVQFLLAASGGLTGEVSRLLNEAAELAIQDRSERITLAHLEQVARG
jgi:type II secretory pathway predicted ATPase ExeA